jgi:error-prone DNA polymerase
LTQPQAEALATSGAFSCFEPSRRKTLWTAGAAAHTGQGQLDLVVGASSPALPEMTERELAGADLWATSIMPNGSPMEFVRSYLDERGVVRIEDLKVVPHGKRVLVAGVVTHRQRPATAEGITFLNLEDETGLANVICSVGVWRRYKQVARTAHVMVVTGKLERVDNVINLVAHRLEALELNLALSSRDFR